MFPSLPVFLLSLPQAAAPAPAPQAPIAGPIASWSTFYWADYDADGLADAWVVRAGGPGRLLRNAGDGNFVDVTAATGLEGAPEAHMALWSDYDGDGRLDLFLPAWRGASQLLRQTAPGRFDDVTVESGLPAADLVVDAEWRDLDADGRPDLRVTRFGAEELYHNAGEGRFEGVTLDLPPATLAAGLDPLYVPTTVDEARRLLSMGAVLPGAAASGPGGATSFEVLPADGCAATIEDASNPAVCLPASSIPTLGMLYPLSTAFYIDGATSFVGLGTTAPQAKLDVVGGDVRTTGRFESLATSGAPLIVNSGTRVANLNADKLDGFDASEIFVLGGSIELGELSPNSVDSSKVVNDSLTAQDLGPASVTNSELAAGAVTAVKVAANAIVNAHVAASAAIAGTKVVPDFGSQTVRTQGSGEFGTDSSTESYAARGRSINGPNHGYLSALGTTDYDGVDSADWFGFEIGVAGISTGFTLSDNFGVLGHSNNVGVRGENSDDPLSWAELGRNGTGLFATGSTLAAELDGVVHVNVDSGNTAGFEVAQAGTSRAGYFHVDHAGSGSAALFAETVSVGVASHAFLARSSGAGPGEVALFDGSDTGRTGINTRIHESGSGEALVVETQAGARAVRFSRSTDLEGANDMLQIDVPATSSTAGQFVEFERGTDIEFRVDVDGDVFADGAFTGPADFAEMIAVSTGAASVEAGEVLVIDPTGRRSVVRSTQPWSTLVAGIYSTRPGFVGSERQFAVVDEVTGERKALKRADMAELHQEVPVAVVGIVPCKVSVENGPIVAGDLLVTSSTPGHAMRDAAPPVGAVVGKALEGYDGARGALGTIKVLVTLQ